MIRKWLAVGMVTLLGVILLGSSCGMGWIMATCNDNVYYSGNIKHIVDTLHERVASQEPREQIRDDLETFRQQFRPTYEKRPNMESLLSIIRVHPAATSGAVPVREASDRAAWVGECLTEFEEIKPGMTRAQIEKRLHRDGGLQFYLTVRYAHPQCPYFKTNVEYAVTRNQADQNRVVPSPDDKAVTVSKPYIEYPACD